MKRLKLSPLPNYPVQLKIELFQEGEKDYVLESVVWKQLPMKSITFKQAADMLEKMMEANKLILNENLDKI